MQVQTNVQPQLPSVLSLHVLQGLWRLSTSRASGHGQVTVPYTWEGPWNMLSSGERDF